MIAAWMLYSCLVAAVLGLAALAAERALALFRRPTRFIWAAGIVGTLVFPLLARIEWVGTAPTRVGALAASSVGSGNPLAWVVAAAASWDRALLVAWGAASLLLLGSLGASLLLLRREGGRWSPRAVNGWPVMVSPDLGPALVGLPAMAIVIPRWFFDLAGETQQLALLHEREHLKAGDARLLMLALGLAALVPWNVVVWWQVRRLRAAVEMDCDARVLRAGVSPGAYANALLEVGVRQRRPAVAQPALAEPQSLLGRRIGAMFAKPGTKTGWMRAAGYSVAAIVLLALACEAPAPEDAVGPGSAAVPVAERYGAATASPARNDPIFVVDGHQMPAGQRVELLDPNNIERIEILKGAAAVGLYGEEGRHGVVQIYTKIYMKNGSPNTPGTR